MTKRHHVESVLTVLLPFFNQGNVNHDAWHLCADAPRLGHKIPALLLRLLGCNHFDTPCGGGVHGALATGQLG